MSNAQTIIDTALSTANSLQNGASNALLGALGNLTAYQPPRISGLPYMQVDSTFDLGEPPQFGGQHYIPPAPDFGSRPEMEPTPVATYGTPPELKASKPTFSTPSKPSQLRSFSKSPPTPAELTVPPAPDSLLKLDMVPPTLESISVPLAPSVTLPEFSAVAPDTNIAAPSDFEVRFAANYANMSVSMRNNIGAAVDAYLNKINPEFSSQMSRLEAKLAQYIEGGTALAPEVEQAIFNRARDKTNAEYLKTRDQIMKEGASKGFTIPGGAQYSALAQARQAASDNNSRAAIDIAIKQAELEQANVQFAVTQSASLRGVVLQAAASFLTSLVQINAQAIEYSRDVLQAAIALYETMVKIATARIEIYKAEAQVYEIRLKAVLAVYDVYQAEIKALEAQVNIDVARVNAFKAQVDAMGALANAYKAVVDGVVAQAQIEKLKVDIFGEEVRAYSAEVGAKQAEWQGFTAQIQGEVAEQQAYGEEVKAFATEVEAHKTNVSAWSEEVRAASAQNEGALKVYQAAIQAYTAQVQGASISAKAEVDSFASTLQGYIAKASAEESRAKANIQAGMANQTALLAARDGDNKNLLATATGYSAHMTNAAKVAVSAAEVYGHMASAALSGLNALAADIDTSTT